MPRTPRRVKFNDIPQFEESMTIAVVSDSIDYINITPEDLFILLSSEKKLSDEDLFLLIVNKHKHKLLNYILENIYREANAIRKLFQLDNEGNPSLLYRFLSIKVRHSIATNGNPLITDHYTASLKRLTEDLYLLPHAVLDIISLDNLTQLYLLKDSSIKETVRNYIFRQDLQTKERFIKAALTPNNPLHKYMAIPQSRSKNIPEILPYKIDTRSLNELCEGAISVNPNIILEVLNSLRPEHINWKKHLLLTLGQSLFDNMNRLDKRKNPLHIILRHLDEFKEDRKITRLIRQFESLSTTSISQSPHSLFSDDSEKRVDSPSKLI